jgi:hypothetical protein
MSSTSSTTSASSKSVTIDSALLELLLKNQSVGSSNSTSSCITLPDGSTYYGHLKNGKPEGQGLQNYPKNNERNWVSYEGEFQNGLPHGQGVVKVQCGNIYEGYMENGIPVKGKLSIFGGEEFWIGTYKFYEKGGLVSLIDGTRRYYGYDMSSDGDARCWKEVQYKDGKPIVENCSCVML